MIASTSFATAVSFCLARHGPGDLILGDPLKFREPGVTVRIGLGIGRLFFCAFNASELVLA